MIIALTFGVCCLTPCLVWFKYVWLPNKENREFRKEMHRKRRERVDEAARVIKETLRLAKEEDARRAKAAQVSGLFNINVISATFMSFFSIRFLSFFGVICVSFRC